MTSNVTHESYTPSERSETSIPENHLSDIRHLLIDIDGVLFRGNHALPSAAEFILWLRSCNVRFKMITNNSTLTPAQNAAKLAQMGIDVRADQVLTSSLATASYLLTQGAHGQAVLVIGEHGLRSALSDAGIIITDAPDDAHWVVAGLDRTVTYEKLKRATLAIERGAHFVATNSDRTLPVEGGLIPGAGALQAAITAATGVEPLVIGKPEPRMLELAMETLGATRESTAMVGDRIDADIAAANACGIYSILVLTGVSRRKDLTQTGSTPSVVVEDLRSLMDTWNASLSHHATQTSE